MSQMGYDAQAHADSQWQRQDLNPGRLGPEPVFLTPERCQAVPPPAHCESGRCVNPEHPCVIYCF